MEAETEHLPGLAPSVNSARAAHLFFQVPNDHQVRAGACAVALRLFPRGLLHGEKVAGAPEGQPRRGAQLAGTCGWQRPGR